MRKQRLKRQHRLLFLVVMAVTMFVFAMIGLYDSYNQSQVNQRKSVYGGWNVAFLHTTEDVYAKICNHAIINRIGKMELYGYVESKSGKHSYTVGSIDDAIYEMGGIKMEMGRFPIEENEIAVEAGALSVLEDFYELGQEIELTIYTHERNGQRMARQEHFIITGIVRNYSDVWKNHNDSLVNFFVSPSYGEKCEIQSLNYYIQVKDQYVENAGELKPLMGGKGVLIENDYTYYEYADEMDSIQEFIQEEILILLVILFAIAILIALINTMVSQRRESFVLIRSIGGEKRYIVKSLTKEIVPIFLSGIAVGTLLGLLIPAMLFKALDVFWGNMTFTIKPVHVISAMSGILLTSIISCSAGFIGILRIPMRGSINYQAMGRNGKGYKWSKRLSLFITFSIGCVFIVSWYSCYMTYYDYQYYKELYPYDYKYGYMPFYKEADSSIPAEVLEKVNSCYGVESVSPYRISPYYEVSWEGIENSEYVEKLPILQSLHLPEEKKSLESVYTCLYEVANGDERSFQEFAEQIDVGSITLEEFQDSNKVIIYLPPLYECGEKVTATQDQCYLLQDNVVTWNEETITIGSILEIQGEKGEIDAEVAAIIYLEQENTDKKTWMPLTIIGNEELGRVLNDINNYTYVEVYGDVSVNQIQTEIELREYCPQGVDFKSQRQERMILLTHFMLQVLIVGVINLIGLTILITIKNGIIDSYSEVYLKKNWLLYALGMSKYEIKRKIICQEIKAGVMSVVVCAIGIICFLYVINYEKMYYNGLLQNYEIIDTMRVITEKIIIKYNMGVSILLGNIYTLLIMNISYWNLKKM